MSATIGAFHMGLNTFKQDARHLWRCCGVTMLHRMLARERGLGSRDDAGPGIQQGGWREQRQPSLSDVLVTSASATTHSKDSPGQGQKTRGPRRHRASVAIAFQSW